MWYYRIKRVLAVLGLALGITAVLTPSLVVNVWPKLQLVLEGKADGNTVGMMLLFAISVPLLAGGIVAFPRTKDYGGKLVIAVLCAALALINGGNAIDVSSKVKDAVLEPRKAAMDKAAELKSRIGDAVAARAKLPSVAAVGQSDVDAASAAVESAATAKTQECSKANGGIGDHCRERMDEERNARDRLAAVMADKAKADQVAKAETKVSDLQSELDKLGSVPTDLDPWATRVAKALGFIGYPFGWSPSASSVSEWWPTVLGVVIELMAMWGPTILINLIHLPQMPEVPKTVVRTRKQSISLQRRVTGKLKLPGEKDSVRQWKDARCVDRAGQSVRCGIAYEDYVAWCRTNKKPPVTLTAFGLTMKNELGVTQRTVAKRSSYIGILITSAPRLAVANA